MNGQVITDDAMSDTCAGQGASTLICRNVSIGRKRTSLRLEETMWDALAEICSREGIGMNELCTEVDRCRSESTLTAGIRVFIVNYFKAAATEQGHASAGHGLLMRRMHERALNALAS